LTTEKIAAQNAHNASTASPLPWKILIADDHELIRKGARAALEARGQTEVWEAENGKEAVEKARALQPHLAILDISMPFLDGFTAARQIREVAPETKILIVSLNKTETFVDVARKIGICGYVTKSDGTKAFLKAVSEALESGDQDPGNSSSGTAEPR
jgi:DNA-binding NarL/FixJ family response regulator